MVLISIEEGFIPNKQTVTLKEALCMLGYVMMARNFCVIYDR